MLQLVSEINLLAGPFRADYELFTRCCAMPLASSSHQSVHCRRLCRWGVLASSLDKRHGSVTIGSINWRHTFRDHVLEIEAQEA